MRRHCLAVLGLTLCSSLGAATLFSDFGPSDAYSGTGWTVSGPSSLANTQQAVAAQFQPSDTAALSTIRVGAFWVSGTDAVTLDLASDSSGSPGSVIESFSLTPTSSLSILTATSLLNPVLSAGTTYWIMMLPGDATTWAAWNENTQGVLGVSFSSDGGSSWAFSSGFAAPVFDVSGSVPEPSTSVLLLSGIGALGFLKRRLRS